METEKISQLQLLLELLVDLNARSGYVSGEELARKFNLSRRSIRRLMSDLRLSGYDIESKQGRYGGYKLNKSAVFPPISIDQKYNQTWLDIRKHLEANADLPNYDDIIELLDIIQMQSQLASDVPYQVYGNKKLMPEVKAQIDIVSEALHEAIDQRQRVNLIYRTSSKGKILQEFRPHQLQSFNNVLYVKGYYSEDLESLRILRLSRIDHIELSYKKFTFLERFEKDDNESPFSKEIFTKQCVELKIAKHRDDFLEYQYGSNQTIYEESDCYRIEFEMAGDQLIKELVLSLGADCEIIKPESVREMIKSEVRHLQSIYDK